MDVDLINIIESARKVKKVKEIEEEEIEEEAFEEEFEEKVKFVSDRPFSFCGVEVGTELTFRSITTDSETHTTTVQHITTPTELIAIFIPQRLFPSESHCDTYVDRVHDLDDEPFFVDVRTIYCTYKVLPARLICRTKTASRWFS